MLENAESLPVLTKVAGAILSAGGAILLAWRGRARWEPSEVDVVKGPQKVAGLINAVAVALIWALLASPSRVAVVAHWAIGLTIATVVALLAYSYLIGTQTYRVKKTHTHNIIGGFRLLPGASERLKQTSDTMTVQDYLNGPAGHDPDKVWSRHSRALAKLSFLLSFLALNVCGTVALTCAAIVLIFASSAAASGDGPRTRRIVHVAIIQNGTIFYNREITDAFQSELDKVLAPHGYAVHYEVEIGSSVPNDSIANRAAFDRLLSRFANDPDYLVTIGTQVSKYAHAHYLNRIPIIFLGVTDPIRSGIVHTNGADPERGRITGVRFDPPFGVYAEFLRKMFPGKRFGFVYNPEYEQDAHLFANIQQYLRGHPSIQIIPVRTSSPFLNQQQERTADIFFGRLYVTSNFQSFTASTGKPFVASDISNVYKGAIAGISANTTEIGMIGATQIIFPNLVQGRALSDMPILAPTGVKIGINLSAARRYGVSVPPTLLQEATAIVP